MYVDQYNYILSNFVYNWTIYIKYYFWFLLFLKELDFNL